MKTILVADDDKNLALLYQQELADEGYRVEVVNDGRQAIERVTQDPPDVLVLDIRMPGIDGIEALQQILAQNNQLPVILNTAYTTYEDNYMTWSAAAYVVKSSDLTELKQRIRQVLEPGASDE